MAFIQPGFSLQASFRQASRSHEYSARNPHRKSGTGQGRSKGSKAPWTARTSIFANTATIDRQEYGRLVKQDSPKPEFTLGWSNMIVPRIFENRSHPARGSQASATDPVGSTKARVNNSSKAAKPPPGNSNADNRGIARMKSVYDDGAAPRQVSAEKPLTA